MAKPRLVYSILLPFRSCLQALFVVPRAAIKPSSMPLSTLSSKNCKRRECNSFSNDTKAGTTAIPILMRLLGLCIWLVIKHCAKSKHTDCRAFGGLAGRIVRTRKRQSSKMISASSSMHSSNVSVFFERRFSFDSDRRRPCRRRLTLVRGEGDSSSAVTPGLTHHYVSGLSGCETTELTNPDMMFHPSLSASIKTSRSCVNDSTVASVE